MTARTMIKHATVQEAPSREYEALQKKAAGGR